MLGILAHNSSVRSYGFLSESADINVFIDDKNNVTACVTKSVKNGEMPRLDKTVKYDFDFGILSKDTKTDIKSEISALTEKFKIFGAGVIGFDSRWGNGKGDEYTLSEIINSAVTERRPENKPEKPPERVTQRDADSIAPHEILRGLRAINLAGSRSSFLLDFVPKLIKNIGKGYDMSVRQREVAVDVIRKNAPVDVVKSLGLFIEPVKLGSDKPVKPGDKPVLTATTPEIIIAICQDIHPYISVDDKWFTPFASGLAGKRFLSPLQQEICLLHLVNYELQLSEEQKSALHNLHNLKITLPKPDMFYVHFTEHYLRFLVEVAKFATASSLVYADKALDEFIRTSGKGDPEATKENAYGRVTWKDTNKKIEKWEEIVVKVHEKLTKCVGSVKGREALSHVAQYITNPELFQDYLELKISEVEESGEKVVGNKAAERKVSDKATAEITTEHTLNFTESQREAAHEALRLLSAACDYAQEKDDVGFNKLHTGIGHRLAAQNTLLDTDMPRCLFLCRFYRGQLSNELLTRIGIIKSRGATKTEDKPKKPAKIKASESVSFRYFACCVK